MKNMGQSNTRIIDSTLLEREKSIILFNNFKFFGKIASGFFSLTLFSILVFFSLYEIKSALGIDLFPGWSLFH